MKYSIEATYRQSSKPKEFSLNMKEVFEHFIEVGGDSAAIAVLQSNEVLQGMVEELGLQIRPVESALNRRIRYLKENSYLLRHDDLEDVDNFSFGHVSYEEKKPFCFYVQICPKGIYRLYNQKKQLLCEREIGSMATVPCGHLTLQKMPKKVQLGKFYPFYISPLLSAIATVKSQLKIYPHKIDKNILQFTFFERDRKLGCACLNHLIQNYHLFLKKENSEICATQLEYLQKRRDELTHYYDHALQEHTDYLNQNLHLEGFMGFAQEIQTLSSPKNIYTSKLFDIDVELQRLQGSRESLSLVPTREEIEQVETQIYEAKLLLHHIQQESSLPITPSLTQDPKTAIALLVKNIGSGIDAQNCASSLKEIISQLEQKQAILEEDLLVKESGFDAFSGLNVTTAQTLLTDYTKQRDGLEAEISSLIFLREQLGRVDFELSCLGAMFDDSVTREIVNRSSAIALQLKDEENRSSKEQERLHHALQTQKNFLSKYLFQTISLKQLRVKLLGTKMDSLKKTIRSLLQSEKQFLSHELQELNEKMRVLPDKWRRESLLELQKELAASMLQGVAQLVEAKTLGQHTFQIGSRSLDKAVEPLQPRSPNILRLTFAGGCAGAIAFFFFFFVFHLLKGLPLSEAMLKRLPFPFSGKLSSSASLQELPAEDLATLRRAISTLKGKIFLYLGGKYNNCSIKIAQLFSISGKKMLLIDTSFDQFVRPDEQPGLWHYLQEEVDQIPIVSSAGYDLLHSGYSCRYGVELLNTPKFKQLLEELKNRYDGILLYNNGDITHFSCMEIADSAIIVIQKECKEDLKPYLEWTKPFSFIYAEKT